MKLIFFILEKSIKQISRKKYETLAKNIEDWNTIYQSSLFGYLKRKFTEIKDRICLPFLGAPWDSSVFIAYWI